VPSDDQQTKIRRYLLNSADYGAAQVRRRAIVIGVRRDIDNGRSMTYPAATHVRPPKDRDGDMPAQPLEGIADARAYWRSVDGVFRETDCLQVAGTELPDLEKHIADVKATLPGIFTTRDLHFGRTPKLLSLARYHAIPENGNRKNLQGKYFTISDRGTIEIWNSASEGPSGSAEYLSTPSWDNHTSGTGDVMGRLRRLEPSVTIRTEFFKPEKGRYLHPTEPRPITHYEAARIQGFPLDFRWCGSKTDIARQIGNAVPIPLGTAIASAIHDFLRG
jgi:DNA (cytosine-5)-methyltransferase 1